MSSRTGTLRSRTPSFPLRLRWFFFLRYSNPMNVWPECGILEGSLSAMNLNSTLVEWRRVNRILWNDFRIILKVGCPLNLSRVSIETLQIDLNWMYQTIFQFTRKAPINKLSACLCQSRELNSSRFSCFCLTTPILAWQWKIFHERPIWVRFGQLSPSPPLKIST